MELTPAQLARFERDGFLIFPDLFGPAEIAVLRQEVARLAKLDTEEVFREHTGGVKSIFRVHEEDGATRSAPFRALVRTPRVLRPVQQVLGGDVYIYHTKINAKPAIEGTIWMWHQDYNSWSKDGCPTPNMATFNVKLQEPKMEQLGKQTIEGVEAEGQRATITIPAGEIGNEQPILIVSETWYSPELQVTVMSRHSDPRMGETVYRLTGINRAEPSHLLFEVPADYTIKEAVEPKVKILLDREMKRSRKPADKQ